MSFDLLVYFRAEANELLAQLNEGTLAFEETPSSEHLVRLLRHAHTLKGAARVVEQAEIASAIHKFEELLTPYRDQAERFPRERIDELLALLDSISAQLARLEEPPPDDPATAPAPTTSGANKSFEEGGLMLLGQQGVEVDSLLEDLRAASGQLEGIKRSLQSLERGKTLAELLTAQLSSDSPRQSARFIAEELQSQLKGLDQNLTFTVEQLERELRQVRESTEKLRLVRAEALFPVLRRVLRDVATERGVSAELVTTGGELRLEAPLLGAVQGALIQAVRNCVAHGLEPPSERERQGKSATGTITLEVRRQGSSVQFRCHDDGRGIDLKRVRQALEQRGEPAGSLDDAALLVALLQGGVSTSSTVSQTAGHGIGLDLISETARAFGGQVELTTVPGRSTQLTLCMPWSVAGMTFLQLAAHGEGGTTSVLLPLENVRAAFRLQPEQVQGDRDGESIVFDGHQVRLVGLNALLARPHQEGLATAVVESAHGLLALRADSLQGTRVANLLPLPPWSQAAPFVAGAALDQDGDPQLVLEPDGLFDEAARGRPLVKLPESQRAKILVIDDSLTTRMLQQSILESAGMDVELASSAEEGLEKAQAGSYHLILVDVEMPGMDGFTFVERLRADPELSAIPAILVTSRDSAEDKLRGHSVGAHGYMVKSEFDQKDLLQQIRRLLA